MNSTFVPERTVDGFVCLNDYIQSLSWSPDGTRLAAAQSTGPVAVVDTGESRILQTWAGHEGGTFAAAFSPVAPIAASVGQDGSVRLWTPESPTPLRVVPLGSPWVEQLAWAPDGSGLAAGAGRTVTVLQPDGGVRLQLPPRRSTVTALAWSADSRKLAATSYGEVQRWDAISGAPDDPLVWKTSLISLAWSPDQRWIVAGTQEQSIQIWELPFRPEGELVMSGYAAKVRELAWHHGSRFLATGGSDNVTVWDCGGAGPAGTTPRVLEGHQGRITTLAYQRTGHLLASGSEDGTVLLWNSGKSSVPLRRYRFRSPVVQISWSPDGARLAGACQDGTVAWTSAGRL